MDQGHRIHDRRRQDVLAGAAGIHPAVRHARPLRARQRPARRHRAGGRHPYQPAGRVTDATGKPVANATVSIWQTGADGLYDIQASATSVDYRGVFATDADGVYVLRTVKPLGYSIPMDGPVGAMVQAQARHGMRPAHIHFLVGAPGYRELVTALYLRDDPHLADDVVFGSSGDLAVDVVANDPDCPIKGTPSIRFDMRLSRESEADKTSGRVGADPSAIMKKSVKNEPTPVGAK
jgi:protocatechuate 3,4-dioxygenase beta subunit